MSHNLKKTTLWIGTSAILSASVGVASTAHSNDMRHSTERKASVTAEGINRVDPKSFPDSTFGKSRTPSITNGESGPSGLTNFPDSAFVKGSSPGKKELVTDPENMSKGGVRFPK